MGWDEAQDAADRARELVQQSRTEGPKAIAQAVMVLADAVDELVKEIRNILREGRDEYGTTP